MKPETKKKHLATLTRLQHGLAGVIATPDVSTPKARKRLTATARNTANGVLMEVYLSGDDEDLTAEILTVHRLANEVDDLRD